MYKEHFRLNEMPFSIAPNPRFLFMSQRHREAMAHLLYAVQSEGGIVLLTGEVGTGKTTICRNLLNQLPENVDVAIILNPRMSVEELLQTICEEFNIDVLDGNQGRAGIKIFIDALNTKLLSAHAQGRRAILIVDEAQNLDSDILEQLRLLTNLETDTHKLLQIFLIGQPELQTMLAQPEMRQLSQRVIARYHLTQLDQSEVGAYISHRLRIAGASAPIFPDKLIKQVYRASGGVPRLINLICDRALLGAYVKGNQHVTQQILRQAADEVLATKPQQQRNLLFGAGILLLLVGSSAWWSTHIVNVKFDWGQAWMANTPAMPTPMISPIVPAPAVSAVSAISAVPVMSALSSVSPLSSSTAIPATPAGIPAPAPAIAPATNLKWPSNIPHADSEKLAFQALFKVYNIGINLQSGKSPCRQVETRGLRCYTGYADWSELLLLNQTVMLNFATSDGANYFAILTALDQQAASLKIAGVEQRVALNELTKLWHGKFVVVWKAPPGYKDERSLNHQGSTVKWLRHVMEHVDGIHDSGSDIPDADLTQRLRAFQTTEGIRPDGLLGPRTVIRLNLRNGKGGPRLVTEKKG